ncbi:MULTISPECIES: succinylglutamate desuccinylase/aspartoacylase domain-containing protein [Sinorhizobium]|uniref:Peptidase M14 n=1 Tax=Sinorhizobium americanum TaxID=194963 RepID=A0A2S3YQK8_9HYPH|nr:MULTISPECIES: succinylglutamate desuccinylase/aspartoacylase family protein [Sinorhizobium]PDT34708.1 peptidase M14 [Sinorhizobium sp. FG01]PDT49505.1 peptidase M14 [Sinorhizobium sp. NG07B]POH33340.1 peptidase M14 [Sinorhizobium americanum]POH33514.1 peptidase M14 [Sinorhizobium americanum]
MKKSIERIAGDTEGVTYEFPVYRIEGSSPDAPTAYLQAALHSCELPGTVAIHALMKRLRKAEVEGRIRGSMTIVPSANPIGSTQMLFGELHGRFHFDTRRNFNRGFPLLDQPDASSLRRDAEVATADQNLKARLLQLSMGHDIVLDLHCAYEGVPYLYAPSMLWPAIADCASALRLEAVLFASDLGDGEFEVAAIHPYLKASPEVARIDRRVVATVEFRGMRDVDPRLAESDAEGLYRLLVWRGVVSDEAIGPKEPYAGIAAPLENLEMMRAPCSGAVLYHVDPGDRVEKGHLLATIVHSPGELEGETAIPAPQSGYVLTRHMHRFARRGSDLMKIIGDKRSATEVVVEE